MAIDKINDTSYNGFLFDKIINQELIALVANENKNTLLKEILIVKLFVLISISCLIKHCNTFYDRKKWRH